MNELTKLEKLNALLTEKVRDMLEQRAYIEEQFDTFKYQVRKVMEENDIRKWETDLFTVTITPDTKSTKVDTDKLKNTKVFITNAETGELEEVGAYEFFTHKVDVKGSFRLKVREEKYGG